MQGRNPSQLTTMKFLCPWTCACGDGVGGSENSHFLGKSLNHLLLPQFIASARVQFSGTGFLMFCVRKKKYIINSINLTSPSLKMSGNLHTKYLRMCAKRGIFMAVHVRNMLPMSPLDTGALSETKQFITAPRTCHLSTSSCNFSWYICLKNSIARRHCQFQLLFSFTVFKTLVIELNAYKGMNVCWHRPGDLY